MITHLKINNFVLMEDVEIDFESGFNVLIGETGTGKSIVLKALMFLLGAKFTKENIRTGQTFTKITGVFSDLSEQTKNILKGFGLRCESDLIISRQADMSGRNEYRANGEIITHSMMNDISSSVINFYGQHESTNLLKVSKHLEILDSFKPDVLAESKKEIAELFAKFKAIEKQLNVLGGDSAQRERTLDLLAYQIKEIAEINPQNNEDIDLENKISLLRNHEKIMTTMRETINVLSGGNGVISSIKTASKNLASLEQFTNEFKDLSERLNSAYYELSDIFDTLDNKASNEVINQFELEELDNRLDNLKTLKKKYGNTISEVLDFYNNAKLEKERLQNADAEIQKLTKDKDDIEEKLNKKCETLSKKRQELATELEQKMIQELSTLGMKNTKFFVKFDKQNSFTANGNDEVEFLFSANLGEELKPLSKTVSGGEMSRFMLALKTIIALKDGVGTFVFDEIDSGISGEIGSAIAEKLGLLSKDNQIIIITHLPQVASMADNFLFVSKRSENGLTKSSVNKLAEKDIILAISRLSGGNFQTEASLAHATELKNWANTYKNSINFRK